MKLQLLRISNFQSFGHGTTEIGLADLTFLIGPNGSGKTALLQALCRLFAFDPNLRRILRSDFHVPSDETAETTPDERAFWIEAEFIFPELATDGGDHPTIPTHFAHMRLEDADGQARIRFRLDATLDADGEIDSVMNYVLDYDDEGQPKTQHQVPRQDRNNIHVHYLPARRDPSDHISFTANSLLGRVLRSVNWQVERESIKELTGEISDSLAANNGVATVSTQLKEIWGALHKGSFFADPKVTFISNEIESLLRHMSVSFTPGHDEEMVDFSLLSDGQKSLLYLSLVLSIQAIGRDVLSGATTFFDVDRLKPAIFTLIAMEEPENSLSPHYLGRVIQALNGLTGHNDGQAMIATHASAMLRRVAPENIRYMRLSSSRETQVRSILMPAVTDEAHKFVREAIQAFPEIYFSRLVILGEGDSEEIVLSRLLQAKGSNADEAAISVAPLGGRHVNHFWRLLTALEIPFFTLLDLDLGRHQGGWGRVRYVSKQLLQFSPTTCGITQAQIETLPVWKTDTNKLLESEPQLHWLSFLEGKGVFFSSPLDLDFAMLKSFPMAFDVVNTDQTIPPESKIKAVLGDSYHGVDQYTEDEQKLFITYHNRFKLGSKPAAHLNALAKLDDAALVAAIPPSLGRMIDAVIARLEELPE
jgi:putative ATP-dependent endonuclease of the OLD family